MALQQYAYKKEQNNRYQAKTESNMYEYIEDTDRDPHTYMASGTLVDSTDSSRGNLNGGVTLTTSKTSYRPIYLALFGGMVIGAVISTLTATIVYHVVDGGREVTQEHEIPVGTNTSNDLYQLMAAMQDTQNSFRTDVKTLGATVHALQERQSALGQQAGFTARKIKDVVDKVLRFETVILNEGDDYNQTSGTFTCSVAGTYLFSTTLISTHVRTEGNGTGCSIVKNKAMGTHTYSNEGKSDSATSTALLHLMVGDVVYVGSCLNVKYILTGYSGSSFIGSLIQAD